MIAGPNGAGKSTIKAILPPSLLGIYINPDEIEKEIRETGQLDLYPFTISPEAVEVRAFFHNSTLSRQLGDTDLIDHLKFTDGKLVLERGNVNAYFASILADFIRQKLLEKRETFTFETVMSSPDKVKLLEKAQNMGFRTYLYYIATGDPIINISRVKNRVMSGGHSVPEEKIRSRYKRSLDLLLDAIKNSDRAFIFDNSADGMDRVWIAEINGGHNLELKTDLTPAWFKHAVWDKIKPSPN